MNNDAKLISHVFDRRIYNQCNLVPKHMSMNPQCRKNNSNDNKMLKDSRRYLLSGSKWNKKPESYTNSKNIFTSELRPLTGQVMAMHKPCLMFIDMVFKIPFILLIVRGLGRVGFIFHNIFTHRRFLLDPKP